jgi:hypothetical protein
MEGKHIFSALFWENQTHIWGIFNHQRRLFIKSFGLQKWQWALWAQFQTPTVHGQKEQLLAFDYFLNFYFGSPTTFDFCTKRYNVLADMSI